MHSAIGTVTALSDARVPSCRKMFARCPNFSRSTMAIRYNIVHISVSRALQPNWARTLVCDLTELTVAEVDRRTGAVEVFIVIFIQQYLVACVNTAIANK